MIKGIKFISIPVSDQNRALTFYTEKLGFRVVTDQEFGPGRRWIELAIPGHDTGVVLFTPEGHESRIGTFYPASLFCDDAHKTFSELTARGVQFDGPPKKEPWGTFMMMRDPDGNQFVVSSR
jgi:catechol 2,3-dioxygenase-like lactoylglutathione lyase family enzyme